MSKLALSILLLCAAAPCAAQESCLAPTPVRSMDLIESSILGLESNWGPSFIGEKCTRLRRADYGQVLNFHVIPPDSEDTSTVYLYVKSYRTFNVTTTDKITMSRGGNWHSENSTPEKPNKLPARKWSFEGAVDRWNELHGAKSTPEAINKEIGKPWHAYADPGKELPSTDTSFWSTGQFDFAKGTQRNYLVRFPANTATTIPFEVGIDKDLSDIRLEFYSSSEALSMKSFRFVFQ